MGSTFSRIMRTPGVYWSSVAVVAGIVVIAIRRRRSARAIKAKEGADLYETNLLVNQYLAFHYCPPAEYVEYIFGPRNSLDFPKKCVDICIKHKPVNSLNRALDIGCAVGRSTFELAREYDEVIGIDYSSGFIRKCEELKVFGQSEYSMVVEGDLVEKKMAIVDPSIDRSRVRFMVGDACNLPHDLGQFGLVFGGNLICRLPEPVAFFRRLSDLIVPGGLLVLTSPYTWLESYTDKNKWLGGFKRDGAEVRGFDTIKRLLGDDFELLANEDLAFVIRETVRKHQWTVSHVTVWKRKGQ